MFAAAGTVPQQALQGQRVRQAGGNGSARQTSTVIVWFSVPTVRRGGGSDGGEVLRR